MFPFLLDAYLHNHVPRHCKHFVMKSTFSMISVCCDRLKACGWQIKIGKGRKWMWCMHGWSKEKGCGANDAFPFRVLSILYSIWSDIPRPFIVKMMKVCAMQTWLLQFIQSKRSNARHKSLAYLCFNVLESMGHI